MIQDRATSEANVARFVDRVVRNGEVWVLVSSSGDFAFCPSNEEKETDVLLFWSDRAYAERHRQAEWKDYHPKSISLNQFLLGYLKIMHEDDILVGPNWDAHLCGMEMKALDLAGRLDQEERKTKAGEPGATDNPDDAQRLREDH